MAPESDYSEQIFRLANLTRSIGAEYGLELMLWATYANWKELLPRPGETPISEQLRNRLVRESLSRSQKIGIEEELDRAQYAEAHELVERLRAAGSELSWTPEAILHQGLRGSQETRAIREGLVVLNDLLQQSGSQGVDRRTAHSTVFEGLLSELERAPARRWEEAATPMHVAELMVALCPRPLGDVLDPAAGLGSSLVAAHRKGARSLAGWDIDEAALRVLAARLELAGAGDVSLRPRNSLRDPGLRPEWDTVLLAPPWGTRSRDPEILEHFPVKVSGTLDVVWMMLAGQLRGSGQAVIHLPIGPLVRPNDRAARGVVLPNIETILALPPGAGAGTGVRSVLLVLSERETDDVLMLNVEDAASSRRRTLEWNDGVLNEVLARLATMARWLTRSRDRRAGPGTACRQGIPPREP